MGGSTPSAEGPFRRLRRLVRYGLLGALVFALKMAMAGLPNIEPVSLTVMLAAVCFGRGSLAAVYVYVGLEMAVWGPGVWNLAYLYVWALLFFLARAFRRVETPIFWAGLSGCFGLMFGLLCAPVMGLMGGWAAALSWWLAGIPMDLLHGAGNFVMALVLFKPMRRVMERLEKEG